VDTVQYWERQIYNLNAGAQNFRLTPFEGLVRNVIFVLRDSSATPRAGGEANWPSPLRYRYDSVIPVDRLKNVWQFMIEEQYGFTAALAANPTNGKENCTTSPTTATSVSARALSSATATSTFPLVPPSAGMASSARRARARTPSRSCSTTSTRPVVTRSR
jgi:hypothetical protein